MANPRRVAVRGIIVKNGKIFAQRQKRRDGTPTDFWSTPGGGLDAGEALIDGLQREMIEETGVAARVGRLLLVQQYGEHDKEHLEFFFHIENTEDYDAIDLASTTHGDTEIYDCGFIEPAGKIMPEILQTLDLDGLTREVQPTVVVQYLAG